MKRRQKTPRSNWQKKVEDVGLTFHSIDDVQYWDESIYYEFSLREIETLERATATLYDMCLEAVEYIIRKNRFSELAIPAVAIDAIKKAWEEEPPSIYGRFDLMWNGVGQPKLLEFNADTPTSLLEAAVAQWYWLEEAFPQHDQFNSIHEKLIAQWKEILPHLDGGTLYFSCGEDEEDIMTTSYLRDTASQAGIPTHALGLGEIGWDEKTFTFRDVEERIISNVFKLYPWEWVLSDFGPRTLLLQDSMVWIEPVWKMLLSNKGLLAILWEMHPGHPNLVEAYLDSPRQLREYVKKPLLSREGANVTIQRAGGPAIATEGGYGKEGFVYQELAAQAVFDGFYPVIGSWMVTDQGPAGIGIRESQGQVTDTLSRFVCHCFVQ